MSPSRLVMEGTGRGITLPNIATLKPSWRVLCSSSAIASSGVCIGMIAAGVIRSPRFWKASAVTMLCARTTARRVASSLMRGTRNPAVG